MAAAVRPAAGAAAAAAQARLHLGARNALLPQPQPPLNLCGAKLCGVGPAAAAPPTLAALRCRLTTRLLAARRRWLPSAALLLPLLLVLAAARISLAVCFLQAPIRRLSGDAGQLGFRGRVRLGGGRAAARDEPASHQVASMVPCASTLSPGSRHPAPAGWQGPLAAQIAGPRCAASAA